MILGKYICNNSIVSLLKYPIKYLYNPICTIFVLFEIIILSVTISSILITLGFLLKTFFIVFFHQTLNNLLYFYCSLLLIKILKNI